MSNLGWARGVSVVALGGAVWLLAACASTDTSRIPAPSGPRSGPIEVVAAENFWGSIAAQLGGDRVHVTSIIASPGAGPHDYEPTPADARAVANAEYVLSNGLGYDPWTEKLVAANPSSRRASVTVQQILGLKAGDNPHRWYAPSDVLKVVDRLASDYTKLDPANAAFFDAQKQAFVANGLKDYQALVAQIKQRYAGVPVGATESIASPLVADLGLKLATPASFLAAIGEGEEPTARDKATFDAQIAQRQIAVLIFNTQNATPDVQRLVEAATKQGIPVVEVTETPDPPTSTFQDWQTAQLRDLAAALAKATGK